MIYAEIQENPSTDEILEVLEKKFGNIEWGDQGTEDMPDAYFWVKEGGVKVAIDNLDSLEFQVKCAQTRSPHIQKVIDTLSASFSVEIFETPKPEPHEYAENYI